VEREPLKRSATIELPTRISELVVRARIKLGMTQAEFGDVIGRVGRTIQRYERGGAVLIASDYAKLATAMFPKDPAWAEALARRGNTTLEALGLVAPEDPEAAAPPPVPLAHLVDSIVCASAAAMNAPPQTIRAAVVAAFDRAASLRLTVDEVRRGLTEPASPT
jgi:transcriptional regulator with XRE-family HTH domain